jgi:hypothetical protein
MMVVPYPSYLQQEDLRSVDTHHHKCRRPSAAFSKHRKRGQRRDAGAGRRGEGPKPKWMRWRTFQRLSFEHDEFVTQSMQAIALKFGFGRRVP